MCCYPCSRFFFLHSTVTSSCHVHVTYFLHIYRNVPFGKQFSSILRPALHLVGCIAHGYKEFYFCSDEDMKKDPNTQVEVIMLVLTDVLCHCMSNGVAFPRNIFVQADNCPREMRNQFTLLWGIAMLLLCPSITSITFNFLRKGHTHGDIGGSLKY